MNGASGTLRKDLPGPRRAAGPTWRLRTGDHAPVTVHVPVLDSIASDSAKIVERAANAGQLPALAAEMAMLAKAVTNPGKAAGRLEDAARYDQLAAAATDPGTRNGYRELAKAARGPAQSTATATELAVKAAGYDRWASLAPDRQTASLCRARARQVRAELAAL